MSARTNPCLIPVRMQACVFDPQTLARTREVVRESGSIQASSHAWAWHVPNYETLDARRTDAIGRFWPRLFESISPPSMSERGGVCLTITPPSGFSKSAEDGDTRSLPLLPDRWLWVRVIRRMHDDNGRWIDETPSVKAWIVDAGIPTKSFTGAPVLTSDGRTMAVDHIGIRRSLDEALRYGPDEPRVPLHVQGTDIGAMMTFAAYAPANLNNTSYLDALEDVSPDDLEYSAISYFLIGWYRNPTRDDPLVRLRLAGKTDDEIRSILDLRSVPGAANVPLGDCCIFHGLVAHIDYWNPRSYLGPAFGSPRAEPVHPCVGTFQHAPQKIGFGATAEEALAALAADLLPDDDSHEKLSGDFFRLLKSLLFDRLDTWDTLGSDDILRQAERNATFQSVSGSSEWVMGPAESSEFPGAEKKSLVFTAEQQSSLSALNVLQAQLDTVNQAFASTAEALYTAWWQSLRARGRRKTALEKILQQRLEMTQSSRDEAEQFRTAIAAKKNELQALLESSFGRGLVEIRNIPTHSFHLPNEPAIAIRNVGPRMPPHPEHTIARTLADVARTPARGNYERLSLAPIRDVMRPYADKEFDSIFDGLAGEAALVEEAIASLLRDAGRSPVFGPNSNVNAWEQRNQRIREQEKRVVFSAANGKEIPLSMLGTSWGSQPWIPIFLDWEVEWFPSDEPQNSTTGTLLNGRTILANRPQSVLRSRLERLEKMSPNVASVLATCRHLLDDVIDCDVLAQSLSGLHQQLLLRDDVLPRILPADEPLRSLVERTSLAPPNLAANLAFDPIRRGSLRMRRLWIVDSFGQALVIADPTINTAIAATGPQQSLPLPTRFLEPSRLAVDFDVLTGRSNPIRAWVLPNLVDQSIVVYDADGIPLGMIAPVRGDARNMQWRPLSNTAPKRIDDWDDPILANFLRPLVEGLDARAQFDALMRHIDEALARTAPALNTASRASMLGRPLVLVQARARIERRGKPIVDPTAPGDNPPETTDSRASNVAIWIGAKNVPDDGVIGFRIGSGSGPLDRTAKLVSGPPNGAPSFSCVGPNAAEWLPLTLLMDPHGKIYLESDTFPLLTLRLPSEWIRDVAAKLPAVLRSAPVLIHSAALLHSLTAPNSTSPTLGIDLPLPIGMTSDDLGKPPAYLSLEGGIDVPVKPLSTTMVVPEPEVAALDGILII